MTRLTRITRMTRFLSQPVFIAFEGVEGCGKSTQIRLLAERLSRESRPHLITREPGGSALGDALRDLLLTPAGEGIDGLTELFLLEASRRHHVKQVIRPALRNGQIVLCDRFADSSVAYQGGGRGLGVERVEQLNALATGEVWPDRTILLDLPAEDGLVRVGRRSDPRDRMEREALDFHRSVRQTYLDIARRRGDRYRVIDARPGPAEVAAAVWGALGP